MYVDPKVVTYDVRRIERSLSDCDSPSPASPFIAPTDKNVQYSIIFCDFVRKSEENGKKLRETGSSET